VGPVEQAWQAESDGANRLSVLNPSSDMFFHGVRACGAESTAGNRSNRTMRTNGAGGDPGPSIHRLRIMDAINDPLKRSTL